MEIKYDVLGKYGEFGRARTIVDENGITWYCANDILNILQYDENNKRKTLARYCRNVRQFEVTFQNGTSANGVRKSQTMNFINRDDIFRLLDHSKMPKAEEFRKWLFSDVIPSIEYTGGYIDPSVLNEIKLNPIKFIKESEEIKIKLKERDEIIEKQKSEIRKKDIKIDILENHYYDDENDCVDQLTDEINYYERLNEENEKYQANYRSLEAKNKRLVNTIQEKEDQIKGLKLGINIYKQFLPFHYPEYLQDNSIPLIRFF